MVVTSSLTSLATTTAAAAAAAAATFGTAAADLFALALLATPFVVGVGTFGDLLGVVFDKVDSGFRVGVDRVVGVVLVVVDDAPNDVFAAGL